MAEQCNGRPMSQSKYPALKTIAEHAGVSLTTAERVLNERGSVSERTRLKVLESARLLGANRILPERWHGLHHFEVILPANKTPLWRMLDAAVKRTAATLPKFISVHRTLLPENDFQTLERAVLNPKVRRSGLIIAADSAEAIAPALRQIRSRGEHVITIVTDVPGLGEHDFAGIDNLKAGRTAGLLMHNTMKQTGAVLVLPVHTRRQEHRDRLDGFKAIIGANRKVIIDVTHEVPGNTGRAVQRALDDGPLAGIYATGHDSHEIAPILANLTSRPIWITHERSDLHTELMREGTLDYVLDQDPDAQIRWALYRMAEHCALVDTGILEPPPRPELRFFCCENLP